MSEIKVEKTSHDVIDDGITVALPETKPEAAEPTVLVRLPKLEDQGSDVAVDQTVNVTINGKVTQIQRGEAVRVKVPVYLQLRNRFPDI